MSSNCHSVTPLEHGTAHAYDHHQCRCGPCTAAKMERRKQRHGQPPPAHGRWAYIEYRCRCPVCTDDNSRYQRERRYGRGALPRNTRASQRRAAEAIGAALASLGPKPPPPLDKVRLLARHERRVVFLIGPKATLHRPPAGPYLEVWPNGNVSHVGPGGHNRTAA